MRVVRTGEIYCHGKIVFLYLFFCVVFSIFGHFFVFCEQGQMELSRRIYASGKDWRDILVQGGGNAHNQVIYSPHINFTLIFVIHLQ